MKCPAFWPYRTGHFPFILYYILLIAMSNVLWCLLKNVAHAEPPNLASHWLQQVLSSLEMIFTLYFYCVCTYYKLRRIGSSQWRRNIFLWWGRGKLIFYRKKFERQNFYLGQIHLPLMDGPSVKCVWYKTIIFFIRIYWNLVKL